MARVTCDSRYKLYLNGELVGRGPIRSLPVFLPWDEYDLAPYLRPGRNVLVALCHYFGGAGRRDWVAVPAIESLGRGSFCFETAPGSSVEILSDASWVAAPAPWLAPRRHPVSRWTVIEIVDGGISPLGLHDPETPDSTWPAARLLSGYLGDVVDRPPAPPYSAPEARSVPHLAGSVRGMTRLPEILTRTLVPTSPSGETVDTAEWSPPAPLTGGVWDAGETCTGYVRLRIGGAERHAGHVVEVIGLEWLRNDGTALLENPIWLGRYRLAGHDVEAIEFFNPATVRYVAVTHPPGVEVTPEIQEAVFPRPPGAAFECDDERYERIWAIGLRTVDMAATDAFVDGSREAIAWAGDSYVPMLVHAVTSPDLSLVRRQLVLLAQARRADGLLSMKSPDGLRLPDTISDYSLHWLRSLATYWRYSGDEPTVRRLLPVADGIIDRYETYRGPSGLLEDVPNWVFIDWAKVAHGRVVGAHDALYAAALDDYSTLPGASPMDAQIASTTRGFEQLWDEVRGVYVDTLGPDGPARRMSQHTNGAALLAGIVPDDRVDRVISRIMTPETFGGRIVFSGAVQGDDPRWFLGEPDGFDPDLDIVRAQPFFSCFLHEGLARYGRKDLILRNLLHWADPAWTPNGTFPEVWHAVGETLDDQCHPWCSTPTFDLTTYVLGVVPIEPGYRRARFDPYLGSLRQASGRVPTPHGWISVSLTTVSARISIPDGVELLAGGDVLDAGDHEIGYEPSR